MDYKYWSELEEMGSSHDSLYNNFSQFKTVTQSALKEIVSHLERISKESKMQI